MTLNTNQHQFPKSPPLKGDLGGCWLIKGPPIPGANVSVVGSCYTSVLNSPRAIQVNIEIMPAFVRLRQMLTENKRLAEKLAQIEKQLNLHDKKIIEIFATIHELMTPKAPPKRRQIGFWKDDA